MCKDKPLHNENLLYLNHHDTVNYVGIEKCKSCHLDKFETFVQTGMGQSFNVASLEKTSANFKNNQAVYDAFFDLYYYPYWENNKFYLKEFRLQGKDTVHSRIEEITYIIGSGHHTNSHFTNENGYFYQAPITFYTQKGKWDLPPGFENGNNTRFSRKIGLECMSCHNAMPNFNNESLNLYENVPHGIDCERCHGPGELHVNEMQKGNVIDVKNKIDYTIVNPGKLPWKLQIDVCQRCHLQGNAVLKPGKNFTDFRPGMPLTQTFDQFSPEYENGEQLIMAAHSERFQQSKCFISSVQGDINKDGKAGFTCISCHNPHVSVRKTNIEKFNQTCNQCHLSNKKTCSENKEILSKKSNNCVECHMPLQGTADIPHVSIHDHFIRKPNAKKSDTSTLKIKGLRCITNKNPDINTETEAYISYYEKFDNNSIYINKAVEKSKKLNTKNSNHQITLIHLYYILKQYKDILSMNLDLKEIKKDAWSCYRIAKANENSGKNSEAKEWFQQCLSIQPKNLDFKLQYSWFLIQQKQFKEAEIQLKEYNQMYSKTAECYAYLGLIELSNKEIGKAKKYFDQSLSLNPDLELALQNLKNIQLQLGNKTEVEKLEQRIKNIKIK